MRIIAGHWRSRRLLRPDASTTRPMPDRVREAIFDILGSHYETPGLLPSLAVADVFAGSGSMGLEALSRGARLCCFVERNKKVVAVLRKNLDSLDAGSEAVIHGGDAWRASLALPDGGSYDLVFLDPPYSDSEDSSDNGRVRRWLRRVARETQRRPLVVLHHFSSAPYGECPEDGWSILDHRSYGTNSVTMFTDDAY